MFAAKRVTLEKGRNIEQYTKKEMALLAKLKEMPIRHCVKFYNAYMMPNSDPRKMDYIFIFELCETGTLEKVMHDHCQLLEDDIKTLLLPLVEFYIDLHRAHILHRDLKPSNVLLRRPWKPGDRDVDLCVTDFGISVDLGGGKDYTTSVAGTPEYMAPEMFRRMPYEHSVDVFAFGLVLYKMLYGFDLLNSDTAKNWDNEGRLTLPKARILSAECFDLLQSCVQTRSENRPPFATILQHPFFTHQKRTPLVSVFNEMEGMLFITVDATRHDYCPSPASDSRDPLADANAQFLALAQTDNL
jgi:serine/threonine protein kinase